MDQHDCLGAFGDGLFHGLRIDAPGIGVDIDEYKLCPGVLDRIGGGDPAEIGTQDFVPLFEAQAGRRKVKRQGAAMGRQGIFHPQVIGNGLFQFLDVHEKSLIPAVFNRIQHIVDFLLGNPGSGKTDFFIHGFILFPSEAIVHRPHPGRNLSWQNRNEGCSLPPHRGKKRFPARWPRRSCGAGS